MVRQVERLGVCDARKNAAEALLGLARGTNQVGSLFLYTGKQILAGSDALIARMDYDMSIVQITTGLVLDAYYTGADVYTEKKDHDKYMSDFEFARGWLNYKIFMAILCFNVSAALQNQGKNFASSSSELLQNYLAECQGK